MGIKFRKSSWVNKVWKQRLLARCMKWTHCDLKKYEYIMILMRDCDILQFYMTSERAFVIHNLSWISERGHMRNVGHNRHRIYRPSTDYYTRWKEAKRLVLLSENWRLLIAPKYDKKQIASLHLRCLKHFGGIINFYFMDSATCPSIKRSSPSFPYKAHLAIYWPLLNYWPTLMRVTTEESAKVRHLQQQSPIRYWNYTTAFLYWKKYL